MGFVRSSGQYDDDQIDLFWNWFRDHLREFEELRSPEDAFWDVALVAMRRVHEHLWFEISRNDDGFTVLVFTVEGRAELFPLVDRLVAKAPPLLAWRFISLKPALGFSFVMDYEGQKFAPRQMWFLPLVSQSRPEEIGLRIGVPELGLPGRVRAPVSLMLDTALGERAAAEDIAHLEVGALPENPAEEGYIELTELPAYLAWHRERRRKGRSD